MRFFPLIIGTLVALNCSCIEAEQPSSPTTTVSNFNAFTGKVNKSKVRMRSGPSLDSAIIRELNKGELFVVVGETEEFFAVQPPPDVKGYIFRTYVLDNKIEGNRVNVRLSPHTDAPVIAQVNMGDVVDGAISPANNKWLEVTPPTATRFYIAKEYLEKVGDQSFMVKVENRRKDVDKLLQSAIQASQLEFQKSFPDIQLDQIKANYAIIFQNYSDFPEQAARAKELSDELEGNYLHKKIAYLEEKASRPPVTPIVANPSANVELPSATVPDPQGRMGFWVPVENALYADWKKINKGSLDDFYSDPKNPSTTLTGVLEPYARTVKNKPGDYVLLDKSTQLPIAFLYSTRVNLHDKVGQEISVEVVSRPNNHFAYPAFFVLGFQ